MAYSTHILCNIDLIIFSLRQELLKLLVSPCWNGEEHIGQCIESVLSQTYKSWILCVVIDEAYTEHGKLTVQAAKKAGRSDSRIIFIENDKREYSLKNRVVPIHRFCPHDAIVCLLDGDDYLPNENSLKLISKEYENDPDLDFLWTQFKYHTGQTGFCRRIESFENPLETDSS